MSGSPVFLSILHPYYDKQNIRKNRIREVELKNGIRLVLKPTLEADSTLLITSFAPFGTSSLSDEEYPLLEGFAGYIDMGDIAKVDGQVLSDLPLPEKKSHFPWQSKITGMAS